MSNAPYRAVIVGLTGIGARRPLDDDAIPLYGAMPRSHAAAYHRHPQTEVVAVCDIRSEALEEFQHDWQDVWPEVRTYQDYAQMLEETQPDIVSVVTPDHLHADITVAASESSAQAIFCEKPIATSLADADRMIAAADANGVMLSVDHTRRWSPVFHTARALHATGSWGVLRGIVANLYSPRAMLFRNGTHMVDTICLFAESEPDWVFAELEEGFEHFTEYKSDGGHDPATDPAASAYIHFANGVRAFYNGHKVDALGSQYGSICEKGRLVVTDQGIEIVRPASGHQWTRATVPIQEYGQTHQLGAIHELIHALEGEATLISPAREARKTVEIILAMLRSHELGNVRVNLPLAPRDG